MLLAENSTAFEKSALEKFAQRRGELKITEIAEKITSICILANNRHELFKVFYTVARIAEISFARRGAATRKNKSAQ